MHRVTQIMWFHLSFLYTNLGYSHCSTVLSCHMWHAASYELIILLLTINAKQSMQLLHTNHASLCISVSNQAVMTDASEPTYRLCCTLMTPTFVWQYSCWIVSACCMHHWCQTVVSTEWYAAKSRQIWSPGGWRNVASVESDVSVARDGKHAWPSLDFREGHCCSDDWCDHATVWPCVVQCELLYSALAAMSRWCQLEHHEEQHCSSQFWRDRGYTPTSVVIRRQMWHMAWLVHDHYTTSSLQQWAN